MNVPKMSKVLNGLTAFIAATLVSAAKGIELKYIPCSLVVRTSTSVLSGPTARDTPQAHEQGLVKQLNRRVTYH